MVKIRQLPDSLSNKIAAGEVVERPASVVKELIENSIDANCTWIKIELVEAGLERIKVIDDGDGMSEGDCERAFLRHATSKIRHETDLFHVSSLGFRGEALPSIASVSKVTIKTSEGHEAGTELRIEGGKIVSKKKADARKGTEITVEELFYNTPARLKYMKTIHTELGHVTDTLNRLALAHPTIRMEATHNGRTLFKTTGNGNQLQVIANIYGMSVAKKMVHVKQRTLDFEIEGYLSKPEVTRASRSYMTIIINGRYVRSIPINQAILRAYHTLLPVRRYPIVVLSIHMDPILVDVNVHPAKLEVRFSKEKELLEAIEDVISRAFKDTVLIPQVTEKKPPQSLQHEMIFDTIEVKQEQVEKPKPIYQVILEPPVHMGQEKVHIEEATESQIDLEDVDFVDESIHEPALEETQAERIPMMYPIGQLHGTYILAQNDKGLYIIDQHAAQERIKYEYFKDKLAQPTNDLQELLIPLTFEFSKRESLIIENYQDVLEQVGLFFEAFGPNTYRIRSHPTWFPKGFEEEVIRDMIEQIIETDQIDIEALREEAAILMACKRSIKANHYLTEQDMMKLLEDLRKTKQPFTCPHGRPVIIHYSTYELEKMFKRVMP